MSPATAGDVATLRLGRGVGLQLRPLTARSAILSLLLGAHPPSATVGELVAFGRQVGINESAVRTAVTRMVSSGDLLRTDGVHTLSDRLLERQRRQDEALVVPSVAWHGDWRLAVVVSNGRDPASRAHLRRAMAARHFGELREGVWMRPDNLAWHPDDEIAADLQTFVARPATDDRALADLLFAPDDWAALGHHLLDLASRSTTPRDRLTAFAAIVRHLTHDPLLPVELLPDGWPGGELRTAYAGFRDEVVAARRTP